jgi:uncharacterized protein (DUF58 family)
MAIHIDRNKFQSISPLEFLANQVVEGFITGLHKSPFHGFSVEFAEHRLYNTGESTRHIDWKLYARTEKLFVKRYEEETNLRCQLLMDVSSSMYYPEVNPSNDGVFNKVKFSAYAAAALISLLRRQRDAVGLSVFDESMRAHSPAKSNAAHHRFLFNQLEELIQPEAYQQTRKTGAVDALHEVSERIPRRSLVVVFSDMFDNSQRSEELFAALQHLRYNKHEVILFHVTDSAKELEFKFENRPYTFVDMETGEQVKAHPSQVRERYLQAVGDFTKELKLRCAQYRIDFVPADINSGFDQVLLQYLIKRSKML